MTDKPKSPGIILKFDLAELAIRILFLDEKPVPEATADPVGYLEGLDDDTQYLLVHSAKRAMEYFQEKFTEALSDRGEVHFVKMPREDGGKPH